MLNAETSVEEAIKKEEHEQTEYNALLGTECDLLVEKKRNTSLYSIIEVLLSIKLSAVRLKHSTAPRLVLQYFSVMIGQIVPKSNLSYLYNKFSTV